jgi:hypothetical protein
MVAIGIRELKEVSKDAKLSNNTLEEVCVNAKPTHGLIFYCTTPEACPFKFQFGASKFCGDYLDERPSLYPAK